MSVRSWFTGARANAWCLMLHSELTPLYASLRSYTLVPSSNSIPLNWCGVLILAHLHLRRDTGSLLINAACLIIDATICDNILCTCGRWSVNAGYDERMSGTAQTAESLHGSPTSYCLHVIPGLTVGVGMVTTGGSWFIRK